MSDIIIEQTDRFTVISFGNGAAYTMTDKQTGEIKSVQYGDEATAWRENYDNMKEAYANPDSVWHRKSWNACLVEIWDQT